MMGVMLARVKGNQRSRSATQNHRSSILRERFVILSLIRVPDNHGEEGHKSARRC